MKQHTYKTIAASVALLFAFAPFAQAAIDIDAKGEVEVRTTGMPVPMLADEKGEAKGGSDDMMGDKSDDGMMEDNDMMDDDDDGDGVGMERAQMMADDHAMFGLETAEMHVDVDKLMKGENEPGHGAGEAEVDEAAKVHSSADFEHFVAHKAKSDSDLRSVGVKEGKIKVEYRMPAKFLGFMNASLSARAEADGKGNVEVDYPWYHIFMKKHISSASLQSEIARALAAKRKAEKEGIATTTIETEVEAAFDAPNLFEMLVDVLHGASMKAKADATASAQ